MEVRKWVKSNVDYGRQLVDSGIEGARSGQAEFFDGKPLAPFVGDSLRGSILPATLGVCAGMLIGYSLFKRKSAGSTLIYGLLGGALGFGAGFAWESRELGASVAGSAMKSIGKTRDEHWLAQNPIDYA